MIRPQMMTVQATLCFVMRNKQTLLLKKSQGLFGAGKWNAPGGKIRPDETPEQAAVREVHEETGLRVSKLDEIGRLNFFKNGGRKQPDWAVYVFSTETFQGHLREGEEGVLRWFDKHSLPFKEMWEDDRYWYPYVVAKRKFVGDFYYTGDFEKLVDQTVKLL